MELGRLGKDSYVVEMMEIVHCAEELGMLMMVQFEFAGRSYACRWWRKASQIKLLITTRRQGDMRNKR